MPSEHPKYGDASYMVFLVRESARSTPLEPACSPISQVEDIIFHVPTRRLKESPYFRDMIDEAHTGLESEGKSNEHPIVLSGISAFEMTSFLDVLEASGDPQLEFSQWAASLHLATMWSFDDIRQMIIGHMDKTISTADPLNRADTSLKCNVEKWLHPAYQALVQRGESLKDEEVERLGLRRSAAIWRVRESLEFEKAPAGQKCPSCNYVGGQRYCENCSYYWTPQNQTQPAASQSRGRKNKVKVDQSRNSSVNDALDLIKLEPALNFK
ncbi:hypothetical protein FRC00_001322 [Tulasnella sp. 408]|nr:hypothetical protein FRC00_001322 [Tulasnella sp. 408]